MKKHFSAWHLAWMILRLGEEHDTRIWKDHTIIENFRQDLEEHGGDALKITTPTINARFTLDFDLPRVMSYTIHTK